MKLTEAQFVKQCADVAPSYPQNEYKQLYHRICEKQFQTDTQDIEKAFERIAPFFSIDLDTPLVKDLDI